MVNSEMPELKEESQTVLVDAGAVPQATSSGQPDAVAPALEASTQSVPNKQLEAIQRHRKRSRAQITTWIAFAVVIVLLGAGTYTLLKDAHPSQPNQIPPDLNETRYQPQDNPLAHLQVPFAHALYKVQAFQHLLLPLGGLSAVMLVVLLGYAGTTRRKYIEFDKIGILISDSRERGEGNARFIPWGCLEAVETLYPKQAAGGPDKSGIAAVSEEVFQSGDSNNCTVVFYVDDGSQVKISWRDIVSCCEPGTFINALKTWAPDIRRTCNFPGQVDKVDTSTYTQLWFKYYSTGSERKRTTLLSAGETLQEGRFEIAGQLGGGGQGTAYLVVDKQASGASSEVVLKEYILPVHRGQQVLQQTVEKLRSEATILAKIDHRNIVKMLGEFIEDHRGYLIMEYVAGRSLKQLVAQQGPQPESAVLELALQICDVLAHLHGMSPPVVHRDLTPDNLILQDDGILKLVDFNVAHQLESAATATVVGKHCYIPPEQFRGKPTPQSDLYAMGGTLFYLLTGNEPEPLTASHPRLSNSKVSEELDTIVAGCTALDAHQRFGKVAQVRAAIADLLKQHRV